MPHDNTGITLSIVVPAHNEMANLVPFYDRVTKVMADLSVDYRVIVVDDGSTDGTFDQLQKFHQKDNRWQGIRLSRNYGQQAAIAAGLSEATGDATIILDCDLQDPPEIISSFLDHWKSGYQVVYAIRKNRKEPLLKRACYKLFYKLLYAVSYTKIPMDAGDFSLIDRRVVNALNALPEHNRYIRGLRAWVGFKQIGIPVDRDERHSGISSYTLGKLVKLAADGFFNFSWFPVRLLTWLGAISVTIGFIYLIVILYLRFNYSFDIPGWTTLVFAVIGFGGANLIGLGIIGEYVGRIFDEVRQRPQYIIETTTDAPASMRREDIVS